MGGVVENSVVVLGVATADERRLELLELRQLRTRWPGITARQNQQAGHVPPSRQPSTLDRVHFGFTQDQGDGHLEIYGFFNTKTAQRRIYAVCSQPWEDSIQHAVGYVTNNMRILDEGAI